MQTWSLASICVLLGIAVRWGVSLNSYSGMKCVYMSINTWNPICCMIISGYPFTILKTILTTSSSSTFSTSLGGFRCCHSFIMRAFARASYLSFIDEVLHSTDQQLTYLSPGAGKPPMFGDYEAQRHWQEVTYNLPVHEWSVCSLLFILWTFWLYLV